MLFQLLINSHSFSQLTALIVTSGNWRFLNNEFIHWAILFLVSQLFMHFTGVSNHNGVFLLDWQGLGVLVATALSFLTETSVIIFTLMGSALVVYAHKKLSAM